MKTTLRTINVRQLGIVFCILVLFFFSNVLPSIADHVMTPSTLPLVYTIKETTEGDIPTWAIGDEWIYIIDPLYYSSPNGSFSGIIQNLKQKVVGIADGMYEVQITGEISGYLTLSDFSGECSGDITGSSSVRVSDLAEGTTELHSEGSIIILIPIPYELDLITTSSPLLELYDFPLHIGEQWQIQSTSTTSGMFNILNLYEESLNGSQFIYETIQCIQQEEITVPAGSFDCYKLARSDTMLWFSTNVGNLVKSIVDQRDENMTLQMTITLQSYTHATQPITVSENVSPEVAIPGSSIDVSGQALATSSGDPIQNGDISIQIPCTGDYWSTTTDANGYYSQILDAPTMIDDTPCDGETGSGGIVVFCTSGSFSGYRVQTFTTLFNTPPESPSIDGETNGKVGVPYSYTIESTDPDDDDVYYFIDWGDTTNSSWVGPFSSEESVTLSHTFTKKGTYTITGKTKDSYNAESDWSTLRVTMPTSFFCSFHLRFVERFSYLFHLLRTLVGQNPFFK